MVCQYPVPRRFSVIYKRIIDAYQQMLNIDTHWWLRQFFHRNVTRVCSFFEEIYQTMNSLLKAHT